MKSAGCTEDDAAWRAELARIADGDADALARLYDGTAPSVYGFVSRMMRDDFAAQEVTLDVYHQVWRQAARYDASRGRVATWLLTMARSRALDRLRRTARDARTESLDLLDQRPGEEPDPAEQSVQASEARRVRGAVDNLSADQRVAVILAFFDGLTHVEIAERLGQPLGTIKTRIRTALTRLRTLLATVTDDGGE